MAFSATVRKSGLNGTSRFVQGTWAGERGDAAGTMQVGSAFVKRAEFNHLANWISPFNQPKETVQTSVSYSGRTATITVYNHQSVLNGNFCVEYE